MSAERNTCQYFLNVGFVLMCLTFSSISAFAQKQVDTAIVIPEVKRSQLQFREQDSVYYYEGKPFSGIVVNDSISEQMYHNGLPIDYRNVLPGTLIRRVIESGSLVEGVYTGQKSYYNTFGIVRDEHYDSGVLEESWAEYYEDGALKQKGSYKAGLKEGHWQRFFRDGTLMEEGDYLDDKKIGIWRIYDADGRLMEAQEY